MDNHTPYCIQCERTETEVPLLEMSYQGRKLWVCPQHLPILIHKPAQLASKLPGAENFARPGEGHDHH